MNTHEISWVDLDENNFVVQGSFEAIAALYNILNASACSANGTVVEVAMRQIPK
jgi:hypothetical protein